MSDGIAAARLLANAADRIRLVVEAGASRLDGKAVDALGRQTATLQRLGNRIARAVRRAAEVETGDAEE